MGPWAAWGPLAPHGLHNVMGPRGVTTGSVWNPKSSQLRGAHIVVHDLLKLRALKLDSGVETCQKNEIEGVGPPGLDSHRNSTQKPCPDVIKGLTATDFVTNL